MIVLGIVGSPAGGKSTVAAHLQALGATWVNADQIARSVLERDEVQRKLIGHFGSGITGNDGRIDRGKLASLVFGDDDAKRVALIYLESVIHPSVKREITRQLKAASDQRVPVAVLDVPLLFKSHWDRCCDEIWCIDAPRELRIRRSSPRGWDDGELRRREQHQLNILEKKRLSSVVILNDGSQDQLTETLDELWSSLMSRSSEQSDDQHCFKDI